MMRMTGRVVVCSLLCLAGGASAQSTASGSGASGEASRARSANTSKPSSAAAAKPRHEAARKPAAATAAAVATPTEVQPALDPELIAVAEQVHLGQIACEMGQMVIITTDEKSPGRFYMHHKQQTYHLAPVMSKTGALRLEDSRKGAVWIQLSNKSMLMNSQLGQRLADECQSPAQAAVAQAMKLAPPIHLLEGGRDVARQ
ncbi:MAG: hypothetical protein RJA69_1742 [Pseudomonadota bacterium]|jgi:hypothetical protein